MRSASLALAVARRAPVRGAGRGVMTAARVLPSWRSHETVMVDGRRLVLDLSSVACMSYALAGDIHQEEGETAFVRDVLRPGDRCVDIGANVGWYTTLMAEKVGPTGKVWAFEPHPNMARLVRASTGLMPQVEVHEVAVADRAGSAVLHVASDEGQSSIGTVAGITDAAVTQVAIDDCGLDDVAFVKCDAEGAELLILQGSNRTNNGPRPPMWMLEWGPLTASYFGGYTVDDLAELLPHHEALWLDSRTGKLRPLPDMDGRINLAFIPEWLHDRVAHLRTS